MEKRKYKLEKKSPCKKLKTNLTLLLALIISTTGCHYKIEKNTYDKIPPKVINTIMEMDNKDELIEEIVSQIKEQVETEIKNKEQEQELNIVTESLLDLDTANNQLQQYGRFNVAGMKTTDYAKAMKQEWQPVISEGQIQDLSIDLKRAYTYQELEVFMKNLAKYEGVNLTIIGKTVEGRNIYSLSINMKPYLKKETVLLTGQIHAREFAGSIFILKQYEELIKKAQTDPYTKLLLENVRFEAVPIINPDGREAIINGANVRKKSNINGVDLNHNFPAVNAFQISNGVKPEKNISSTPGLDFFPGYNLGSEPETQALMKWLHTYIPETKYYMDYHQQGRVIYAVKPWDVKNNEQHDHNFTNTISAHINNNSNTKYRYEPNTPTYGFNGSGGTVTDYATSISMGFKFSKKYGRMVLNVDGQELPLLIFKDLDYYPLQYKPVNNKFATLTLEIGRGLEALGYDNKARQLMAQEYTRNNYNTLLSYTAELAIGAQKVNELKEQIKTQKNNNTITYLNNIKKTLLANNEVNKSNNNEKIYALQR